MEKILNLVRFYSIGIFAALVFFLVGVATISHYGLNIDEPIHFIRGHAYLHLLLSGEEKYRDEDLSGPRVSDWKIQQYNGSYFISNDSGHPPLNGIFAAASNIIFYEKLGIFGDLESYHLFEIFVSSSLVFLIYVVVRRRYGIFAGIISVLSLSLYPLFLGESRFNIKDPIEAAFFAFTIFFFYLAIEKKSGLYFFISSLFCALALSTKFNIVFLPFIIAPYLIVRYFGVFRHLNFSAFKSIPVGVYISLIFYPIVVLGIHFYTRPFLWQDPVNKFIEIVQYYQGIGTGRFYQPDYVVNGWNLYPPFFVGISTPPVILFFSLIGIIGTIFLFRKEKDKLSFLILLWFIVPIARVMWPGSSIYSGVRQIMEYVPAMAMLSGIGANFILEKYKSYKHYKNYSKVFQTIIILSFIPIGIKLISMHPNENVYINSLVGGLKGAYERKIPGAGESMGNVYLQGLKWINENAERNARYHLPVGLGSNIPRQFERKDIKFGPHFSGMKRDGEYMMEMISVDFPPARYNFEYLNTFINPVYELKVDQATILKIWKNDKEHTKKEYLNEIEIKNLNVSGGEEDGFVLIELENPAQITRVEIDHDDIDCIAEGSGDVTYSLDGKKIYHSEDDLYRFQGPYAVSLQSKKRFVYFFPGTKIKWLQIFPADPNLCILQVTDAKVWGLRDFRL